MHHAAGRLVSVLVLAAWWLLTITRIVFELIGYSTLPEDTEVARTRYGHPLKLLLAAKLAAW